MRVAFRSPFAILNTEDVPRAVAFYRDLLGFAEAYRFPEDGAPTFVTLRLDGAELGISEVSDEPMHGRPLRPATGHRFEMCVYADDADEAVAALRSAGVPVLAEPADQPWGERVAFVEDPDGTPVLICAPIER